MDEPSCALCRGVLRDPVTLKCQHQLCKECIDSKKHCAGDATCSYCGEKLIKKTIVKNVIIAVATGAGAVSAVALAPVALTAAGFTSAGIAAGSLAAQMMSAAAIANGGGVAAGSLVAVLQSAGAVGLSATANAAVAGIGGAVGWLTSSILTKK